MTQLLKSSPSLAKYLLKRKVVVYLPRLILCRGGRLFCDLTIVLQIYNKNMFPIRSARSAKRSHNGPPPGTRSSFGPDTVVASPTVVVDDARPALSRPGTLKSESRTGKREQHFEKSIPKRWPITTCHGDDTAWYGRIRHVKLDV
ncbi:hypothetical protein EVAR_47625_1 [Eumeta japonica]|uniref:Uncharacterized protein n=1 Tax=Eumeta variegata TaxID=151549 RepID=A0A4C1ZE08_EUMVA|nr:hypothetical protein EVAR_47625_1 [Eumeta japonica]